MWSTMERILNYYADIYFPIKKFKKKPSKNTIWLNLEIQKEIEIKNMLLLKAKKSKDRNDIKLAHKKRNHVNRLIKNAKKNYYKDKLNENIKNSKDIWKFIRELFPNKNNSDKIQLFDSNNELIDQDSLPDHINEFFNSVGKSENSEFLPQYGPHPQPLLVFRPVTVNMVIELIQKINVTKSSSVPNLPSKILKAAFLSCPNVITYLFNQCILRNIIPDDWKSATVIPIKKVSNCKSVNDLRPISLIPLPCKLLEKIIYTQCIKHLKENQFLDENQFGFQQNSSTISAISELTDDISFSIEKKFPTIATFIDFTKAFDKLNHKILLQKLKFFGFSDMAIKFFENYLSNRKQTTLINNIKSKPLIISHGVPQGSNVGPLLFLLYINDIGLYLKNTKFKLFADDTTLYHSHSDIKTCINELKNDLKNIEIWCKNNNMEINAKKTKVMIFGNRNMIKKHNNIIIKLNEKNLQTVPTFKYLGFNLDSTLSYNQHVNIVSRNAHHKLYQLKRINAYLTEDTSLMIFKSYILPILDLQ